MRDRKIFKTVGALLFGLSLVGGVGQVLAGQPDEDQQSTGVHPRPPACADEQRAVEVTERALYAATADREAGGDPQRAVCAAAGARQASREASLALWRLEQCRERVASESQ